MTSKHLAAGSVSLCDAVQNEEGGRVTLCDPAHEEDGRVTLCGDQLDPAGITPVDPCANLAALTIDGPTEPDEDSGYSATGGRAPYIWSISSGSISDNGAITDLTGVCGAGTVSVTDSCGNSASMEVRFSDGQWVFSHTVEGPCGIIAPLSCDPGTLVCGATITGGTKADPIVRTGNWAACIGGLDCSACVWAHHIDSVVCAGTTVEKSALSACGSNASVWALSHTDYYTWSCP